MAVKQPFQVDTCGRRSALNQCLVNMISQWKVNGYKRLIHAKRVMIGQRQVSMVVDQWLINGSLWLMIDVQWTMDNAKHNGLKD